MRPRAARVAQSGSSTRESRNASGSRPSTGQSSSSVVSKRSGNGAGTRTPSSSPRARRRRRGPSGPKRSARATGGRRARSPIVRRPQRWRISCRSAGRPRRASGRGASAAASRPAGTTVSPGHARARTSAAPRVKARAAWASIARDAAASRRACPSSCGVGHRRPRPERSRRTGVGAVASTRGVNSRARARSAPSSGRGRGECSPPNTFASAPQSAAKARSAVRRPWRPARARAASEARSRAGPGGPDQRSPAGSRASALPPGPQATWPSATSTTAVGAPSTRRCRRSQVVAGQAAALVVGAGEIERHHVEEKRAGERRHRRRGVGERLHPRLLRRAARAAQPQETRVVRARGGGRAGVEAVERVHERGEGARARRPGEERVENAGAARGGGAVDLGEMPPREAAVEQRVQLSDAGRERPPPLLAPQRRLVGLEAPRPQQVLEGALPLDRGRRERGGRGEGRHSCAFAFSSPSMIGRGPRPSIPKTLGSCCRRPQSLDPVRGGLSGEGSQGGLSGEAFEIPRAPGADGRALG